MCARTSRPAPAENGGRANRKSGLLRAGEELQAEVKAQTGFSRVRVSRPKGSQDEFEVDRTLARILTNKGVVAAADEFTRRIEVPPRFWRDLLEAAATGPADFRAALKFTNGEQVECLTGVIEAGKKFAEALDYALIPVYPDTSEEDFFRQLNKIRSEFRSPRVPGLSDCSIKISSSAGHRADTPGRRRSVSRCIHQVSVASLVQILTRILPLLIRERESLADRPDTMQLRKGDADIRFIVGRLDSVMEKQLPKKIGTSPVKTGKLIRALINAALDNREHTSSFVTAKKLADCLRYLRTKGR